jgi:Flp pilus assembly protein TadG
VDNARTRAGVRVAFEPCSSHLGRGAREGNENVLVGDHRLRADDRRRPLGQALVEFALVAPILMLILATTVQLAFIYERQIGIENAVRDAARRGATLETLTTTDSGVNGPYIFDLLTGPGGLLQSNVQDYSSDPAQVKVASVCYRTQVDAAGNNSVMVKVSVGYAHPLFLPIITQILDGFDGVNDSAFRVDTSSEFQVQNAVPASVDACYP